MTMRSRSTLFKLTCSYLLLILLPICIILLFTYARMVDGITENVRDQTRLTLQAIDFGLQGYLTEKEKLTYNAMFSDTLREIMINAPQDSRQQLEYDRMFQETSNLLLGDRYDTDAAYLLTVDGRLYYVQSAGTMSCAPLDPLEEDEVIQHLDASGKLLLNNWRPAVRTFTERIPYITIGRRMFDYDTGDTVGYLFLELNYRQIAKLIEGLGSKDDLWLVLDENGTIALDKNKENLGLKLKDAYPALYRTGEAEYRSADPVHRITAYPSMQGWSILSIASNAELSRQVRGAIVPIATLAGLCAAVFLGIAWLIAYDISQPIRALSAAMTHVERGDFSHPVALRCGGELEALGNRFDHMVATLQQTIARENELRVRALKSQLIALQAQINPHFLNNALESISCLARLRDEADLSEMVVSLAKMIRYGARSDEHLATVWEELQHANHYAHLERVPNPDLFSLRVDVDEAFLGQRLPRMCLQPLVENAILHGFKDIHAGGQIEISARWAGRRAILRVADNGCGMDAQALAHFRDALRSAVAVDAPALHGVALRNIAARLRLSLGAESGLMVTARPGGGTLVALYWPMQEETCDDSHTDL
jgi:two-component system sensor histidine kinase YesM